MRTGYLRQLSFDMVAPLKRDTYNAELGWKGGTSEV